ncbi:hypothetical protein DV737_g788, partial [Chaetothyriales sp. CBS 132003]
MAAASQPSQTDIPGAEARAKLIEQFSKYQGDDYVKGWADLWEKKDFLPWDRGRPSPALEDALINHREVIGDPIVDGRRKRALVPGCGRGYDVLLLESFGYDAVGVEVSEEAYKAALNYAEQAGNTYPVRDAKAGKGTRTFVLGDFYKNDFLSAAGLASERFDLIYDYTFFCAMDPLMRPAWAQRMSELLMDSVSARLICLEFPTQKQPSTRGPPYGSPPEAYMAHLSHPGSKVPYDEAGNVKHNALAESNPAALERIGHWHPADTHALGRDEAGNIQDYVSVWRHK